MVVVLLVVMLLMVVLMMVDDGDADASDKDGGADGDADASDKDGGADDDRYSDADGADESDHDVITVMPSLMHWYSDMGIIGMIKKKNLRKLLIHRIVK